MATKSLMTQIGEVLAGRLKTLADKIASTASEALASAKTYTDQKIADLVNSAPETLDTLGEIADAIKDNQDAIDAINAAVAGHDHDDATQEKHGSMSTADKTKLDALGDFGDFTTAYNAALTGDYTWLQA